MRLAAMAATAVMAGGSAWAEEIARPVEPAVVVCMALGFDTLPVAAAQKLASQMFAGIGVQIEWPQGRTPCTKQGAIVVDLSYRTAEDDHPDAWAYARPYEGTHIVVFWDRIQRKMPPMKAQVLLAHVLVHEITHILQAINRHSESGVMKAQWSDEDLFQMMRKPLGFTESDILIIRRGLEVRSHATLAAVSAQK